MEGGWGHQIALAAELAGSSMRVASWYAGALKSIPNGAVVTAKLPPYSRERPALLVEADRLLTSLSVIGRMRSWTPLSRRMPRTPAFPTPSERAG